MFWDLNPAKTIVPGFRTQWSSGSWCHITERIQWERKWEVRSGFIQIQRDTLHRQRVGHCKGWVQPWNLAWLAFIGWVTSYARVWGLFQLFLGRAEMFRIWSTAHSLVFLQCLGTVMAPLGVSFHLMIEDQGPVLSANLILILVCPFDFNWLMLCVGLPNCLMYFD